MKVLLINTSERVGGAAVAANRLRTALQKAGHTAYMLVRDKQTKMPEVVSVNQTVWDKCLNTFRFLWERLTIFFCNQFNRKNLFQVSIANTGMDISKHPLVHEADIIHLHWINQGFLSLSDIRKLIALGKPTVWTMHDMWPFTAICHHSWDCERYRDNCGKCPFLLSHKEKDLSSNTLQKKRFLNESCIQLVSVSRWLKELAQMSSITNKLSIQVIPNVIDISLFQPADRQSARQALKLPVNKKIILMGAARLDTPIKGFDFLREALEKLKEKRGDLLLVLFGDIKQEGSLLSSIPIDYSYQGLLADVSVITQLYAAADVTVVPSYYETFGQTLIESMACGCPVVSFDNSGQTDIIEHKKNGYLARFQDTDDLAKGIEWVIDHSVLENLSEACIKKVQENYTESVVANQYINLYNSLLDNPQ